MKQLLEYIIPNIVTHPEDVQIQESTTDGIITLSIKVNPEDMGRVIGKSGKVIKAIRQIARVIAIKQGVRVNIDVLEEGQTHSDTTTVFQAESSLPEGEEMLLEETTQKAQADEEASEDK